MKRLLVARSSTTEQLTKTVQDTLRLNMQIAVAPTARAAYDPAPEQDLDGTVVDL